MSETANTQNNKKYCLYQDVEVVISSFNNYGKCGCLKCTRKNCNTECKSFKSATQRRIMEDRITKNTCFCNECINATIYGGQQR